MSATDDPHLGTAEQEPLGPPPVAPLRENWHYFTSNRGALIGLVILGLMVLTAVFAPLIAPRLRRKSRQSSAHGDGGASGAIARSGTALMRAGSAG